MNTVNRARKEAEVQAADATAQDTVQAQLMDAVFNVKNAVEDRDVERLRRLFADRPKICVQGRFLSLDEFLKRLHEFFKRVEHISMDITRVEEIDREVEGGLIAVLVDFGWIDSELWEEQTVGGLMTLTLAKTAAPRRTAAQRRAAADEGATPPIGSFTYAALPRQPNGGREPDGDGKRPPGGGGVGPRPETTPTRGYTFW